MKNLFVLLMCFVSLWSCKNSNPITENNEATLALSDSILILDSAQRKQLNIQTTLLQQQNLQKNLRVIGKIEVPPQYQVAVSVPTGGYLKSISTQAGKSFRKGEVLATFEDLQYIDLQKNYLQAIIQLQQAQLELERQKTLYQSEAVSNKFVQEAQARCNELNIEQKALAEKLALLRIDTKRLNAQNISKTIVITAPFDGITAEVFANIGKYCLPTDVVFTLVQPKHAQIKLSVFEKDLTYIQIGQEFTASYMHNKDNYFKGKLSFISPKVEANGVVNIVGEFESPTTDLLNGRMMQAEIITAQQKWWCLPKECLITAHQQHYLVAETTPNHFELKTVTVTFENEHWVAIAQPENWLKVPIVQSGAYRLFMAMQ